MNHQAIKRVTRAWGTRRRPTTADHLAAVTGVSRGQMSLDLQEYVRSQGHPDFGTMYPTAPVLGCKGYGRAAEWHVLDTMDRGAMHTAYVVRDAMARLFRDVSTEVAPSAVTDDTYQEMDDMWVSLRHQMVVYVRRTTGRDISPFVTEHLPTR